MNPPSEVTVLSLIDPLLPDALDTLSSSFLAGRASKIDGDGSAAARGREDLEGGILGG